MGGDLDQCLANAPPPQVRLDEQAIQFCPVLLKDEDREAGVSDHGFGDDHLAQFDLPYGRLTIEALLRAEGFEPPERKRLDAEWRAKVLAEWDAAPPKSYQSLHARLAARDFPYGRGAMQDFLESEGRVVRYRDFLKDPWRAEALEAARAAQPIANVAAFHRLIAPPMTRRVFRDFLIREGIEVARRPPKTGKTGGKRGAPGQTRQRAGDAAAG